MKKFVEGINKLSEALNSFKEELASPSDDEQVLLQTVRRSNLSSTKTTLSDDIDLIDMKKWKSEILKHCAGASFEKMIKAEPDLLPRREAELKIQFYLQMIWDSVRVR